MITERAMATPWHRESFDRWLNESLPRLLAQRLPLSGYQAEITGETTCRVRVQIADPKTSGEVAVEYAELPRPDAEGVFTIDGTRRVVVPLADHEHLDTAEVACVGEQLYAAIEARLGQAPEGLPWDDGLLRTWLPLDTWVHDFLRTTGQTQENTNWLARRHHLRRIRLRERREVIAPGQFGRVCPFETPEGPNIGRILLVATGAAMRDGRIVALGTTVTRALESAAQDGALEPRSGETRLFITPGFKFRLVDAIVSGTHEPGSSHHELLRAFADDDALARATEALERHRYRTDEFGDSIVVMRRNPASRRAASVSGAVSLAANARAARGSAALRATATQ